MSVVHRRELLKKLTLLPISFFGATFYSDQLVSKSRPVKITIDTIFPREMTQQEFEQEQLKFVRLDQMGHLLNKMKSSQKIYKDSGLIFSSTASRWELHFDSFNSYVDWNQKVTDQLIVDESSWSALNYKIKVTVEHII